jgi:hypothetical protein
MGELEIKITFSPVNLKGRHNLGDLGIDGEA